MKGTIYIYIYLFIYLKKKGTIYIYICVSTHLSFYRSCQRICFNYLSSYLIYLHYLSSYSCASSNRSVHGGSKLDDRERVFLVV